jgi:hypothetical protein
MTLVNEAPRSYYSGMLPGAVSSKNLPLFNHLLELYTDADI